MQLDAERRELFLHPADLLLAFVQPLPLGGGKPELRLGLGREPLRCGELSGQPVRVDAALELGELLLPLGDRSRAAA